MELEKEMHRLMDEVMAKYRDRVEPGDIFVLGCSTSEIAGHRIGKGSQPDYGQVIIQVLLDRLPELGLHLAVQGCEHINRSLVVERQLAKDRKLDIVSVLPSLDAGGSCSVAAYTQFADPVNVEHIQAQSGIDIGDTHIGMHIQHVQVPIRFDHFQLGQARVHGLVSRPKLIGGPRAQYPG